MSLYSYCGNNPFNFLDPGGLCKESLFDRAMNVAGRIAVPVTITCLSILYPPVGVAVLMVSGFMGGLYVGEGLITGTDIYGNPLSTSQRVYRTAVGTTAIALLAYGAAQMQGPPGAAYHYTSRTAAAEIESSGRLGLAGRQLYVTPNGNLSPLQAQIELSLPSQNTAQAVFRVNTRYMNPFKIVRTGRVVGNVAGRAGGGMETVYSGTLPRRAFTRIR